VSGFAATPSDSGHGHGPAGDHHLDLDLGELPTLWYGETHQIRTDETLTPVQGNFSFSFPKKFSYVLEFLNNLWGLGTE
jgi:hypothetical protein